MVKLFFYNSFLGEVKLTEFESSPCGIVQSFVTRFPVIDADLESLWSKDREQWK